LSRALRRMNSRILLFIKQYHLFALCVAVYFYSVTQSFWKSRGSILFVINPIDDTKIRNSIQSHRVCSLSCPWLVLHVAIAFKPALHRVTSRLQRWFLLVVYCTSDP
jgi:hypothetical protein